MAKYDKIQYALERIIHYCSEVEDAVERFGNSILAFHEDFVYRNTCAMSMIQIGEFAAHLPMEFLERYGHIPWKQIRGMRNWFVHDYDNMDEAEIWRAISADIPKLLEDCKEIMRLEGYKES
jgi:uncharacterized protein with HEPN domain